MYFKLPLLCLLAKYSYKHKIPDKVANRQDGRFDLNGTEQCIIVQHNLKLAHSAHAS